ncbi:MAG TPA: Crp/Fnr family transcriptional regulator [Polyangiaceae bacterium]|nr:Crp/Fnr family transcriptional regulator [Polyangiaceae bacterium]
MRPGLTPARFPFFTRLSAVSQGELGVLRETRVEAGERLLERGDPVGGAYFVVGGSLRVYYVTPEGREATLYRVEPGGTCLLALTATFTDAVYPAWVEAGSEGATFVCVPRALFRRLFDVESPLREFVFAVLSGRIFELMQALEETGSSRIDQRVARHLLRRADAQGVVRQSQTGMASDLGTAREVVFRALRSLAGRGLIETGRVRVRIADPAGLRALAEAAADASGHGDFRP